MAGPSRWWSKRRGKRRIPGEAPATETPAAEPAAKAAPAKAPLTRPATPSAPPRAGSGVVLRTLTGTSVPARASALADCQDTRRRRTAPGGRGSQAPQQPGRHRAGRARGRRSRAGKAEEERHPQDEEAQAQGRTRSQEAIWRSRSARRTHGSCRARRAERPASPPISPTEGRRSSPDPSRRPAARSVRRRRQRPPPSRAAKHARPLDPFTAPMPMTCSERSIASFRLAQRLKGHQDRTAERKSWFATGSFPEVINIQEPQIRSGPIAGRRHPPF